MDFDALFQTELDRLREDGNYRVFADLERVCGSFPKATRYTEDGTGEVTVWCSNDYLGMGQNPVTLAAMHEAIDGCGAGAGGTRNISGTNHYHMFAGAGTGRSSQQGNGPALHIGLRIELGGARHPRSRIPNLEIFSDAGNHASMIEGIRHSRAPKHIWKHNDVSDLERKLAAADPDVPKLIAFESVYSMDGDIAPICRPFWMSRRNMVP